jgi:hypothetical protein
MLSLLISTLVQLVTPSNSFSLASLALMLSTPYILRSKLKRMHTLRTVSGEGNSASVSVSIAAIEDAYTESDLFETICQIRGDDVDDAGTHELVHHIRSTATLDEQALGSFTPRKLKQLPIWDLWLPSEWKQLVTHQKQKVFRVPCPAPPGATVLCPIRITSLSRVGLATLACCD